MKFTQNPKFGTAFIFFHSSMRAPVFHTSGFISVEALQGTSHHIGWLIFPFFLSFFFLWVIIKEQEKDTRPYEETIQKRRYKALHLCTLTKKQDIA